MNFMNIFNSAVKKAASNETVSQVVEATDKATTATVKTVAQKLCIRCPKFFSDPAQKLMLMQVFLAVSMIGWVITPDSLGRRYVINDLLGVVGVSLCAVASLLLLLDYIVNEEPPLYEVPILRRHKGFVYYVLALGWFCVGVTAMFDVYVTVIHSFVLCGFATSAAINVTDLERRKRQAAALTGRQIDAR